MPWPTGQLPGMTHLFTEAATVALGQALNASDDFREAARTWDGGLVLEAQADSAHGLAETTAVFLVLDGGACRTARLATADDRAAARFVITGALAEWLELLAGGQSPASAIMRGALSLQKGSLMALLPHVQAAHQLARVARGVLAELDGTAS